MGLFDDIPAAPKATGLFDDLPDAPKAAPRPVPQQAGNGGGSSPDRYTVPARQDPNDPNQALLQSHYDTEAALSQRAAPLVRNAKGELVRKVIGEIEEFDFGPAIRTPAGELLAFNPKTDVMLRDPQTGRLTAFERSSGGMDNPGFFERVGRALLPGFMTTAPTRIASSSEVPMAVQRGRALGFPVGAKAEQMGSRIEDAAAFRELDTEPFAPAFRSKGAARFARTVEEMPVVGGIVKGPKTDTELKLAESQARIASELGAPQSDEAAGRVLQTGLDRFRTAGVRQIEPGVLEGMERTRPAPGFVGPMANIEARAPVQPAETLSAGARRSAENAEPIRAALGGGVAETARGVQVPAARPLNQVILARRGVEDMDDAELMRLVRSPASETSFGVRQEALYERAHRSIPALFRSDGSRNPNEIATPNAGQVARGLQRAEESARIKGGALEGRFGQLVRDLQNSRSNFTLDSLKAARTQIGKALASFGEYDTRLDRSQLKALYAAISRDYEAGLQTLANRAYERTRLSNNAPDYVPPDVARAADRALREMRVADRYTRLSMERMDRFTRLLNADSPEAAMRGLSTRIREGTIDRGMVRAVADALRPEEREAVLGYLVANMGKTRPGGKESEIVWNIHTFATDWNRNKVALRLLSKGTDPKIVDRLEALAKISERMKFYETTKNYSGSAYAGIPAASLMGGAAGGLPGIILTAMVSIGGGAAAGKFLTTPKYLNWMVRAASEGQVPRARGPQVGGTKLPAALATLERLAANDNQLGPIIRQAVAKFLGDEEQAPSVNPEENAEGGGSTQIEQQYGQEDRDANAPLHGGDTSGGGGGVPSGDIPLSDMGPQPWERWPEQHISQSGPGVFASPAGIAAIGTSLAHGLFVGVPEAEERLLKGGYRPGTQDKQAVEDAFAVGSLAAGGSFAGVRPAGSLGTFIGRQGAENLAQAGRPTALKAIAEAQRLESVGLPQDAIRSEVNKIIIKEDPELGGVWRGDDGMWRVEISDKDARVRPVGPPISKLGREYAHPELYQAYPDMPAIDFIRDPNTRVSQHKPGDPSEIILGEKASNSAIKRRSVAEEVGHEIDFIEDFARGGSPEDFKPGGSLERLLLPGERPIDGYRRLSSEVEKQIVKSRIDMSPKERRNAPPWDTRAKLQAKNLVPEGPYIVRKGGSPESKSIGRDPDEPSAFEQAQDEQWKGLRRSKEWSELPGEIGQQDMWATAGSQLNKPGQRGGGPGPAASSLWHRDANLELAQMYKRGEWPTDIAARMSKKSGKPYTEEKVVSQLEALGLIKGSRKLPDSKVGEWQPDAVSILQSDRIVGMSYADVAKLIEQETGQVTTKNAVAGKIRRLRHEQARAELAEDLARTEGKPGKLRAAGVPAGKSDDGRRKPWSLWDRINFFGGH